MRLCKSYRVNPQSECNERAHRSTLMADKCHPGAWFDKLTNLVKIPACTEQGRSKHAEGTF